MSVGSVDIRTRIANGSTYIDLRVSHPMESGARTDAQGVVIPSWYLTHLDVHHNDNQVAVLELGPLVSRNPAISLVLNGGEEDEIIKVTWHDNRGKSGEKAAKIVA